MDYRKNAIDSLKGSIKRLENLEINESAIDAQTQKLIVVARQLEDVCYYSENQRKKKEEPKEETKE